MKAASAARKAVKEAAACNRCTGNAQRPGPIVGMSGRDACTKTPNVVTRSPRDVLGHKQPRHRPLRHQPPIQASCRHARSAGVSVLPGKRVQGAKRVHETCAIHGPLESRCSLQTAARVALCELVSAIAHTVEIPADKDQAVSV